MRRKPHPDQLALEFPKYRALFVATDYDVPRLSQPKGEIELRGRDKTRWHKKATPAVRRIIQSYLDSGWDLEEFKEWPDKKGFDCHLRQSHILTGSGQEWAYSHCKILLVSRKGKIAQIHNEPTHLFIFDADGEPIAQ